MDEAYTVWPVTLASARSTLSNGKIANYKRLIVFASISNRLTLNFHTRKAVLLLFKKRLIKMNEWIKWTPSVKHSSVHLQILRNPPVCPTGRIKCLTWETILPHQPELQHARNPNFGEVTPKTKFLFSGSVIQSGSKYNINPLNLQQNTYICVLSMHSTFYCSDSPIWVHITITWGAF